MSTKQRGLGKGLGAFFTAAPPADNELRHEIELGKIKANPNQPRKVFNEEKLAELADSISMHGIIQPLVVRKKDDYYEIVAGERRWRAAQRVKLEKLPVVIREYTDEQIMQIALVENIQRHDLNAIEEARALKSLINELSLTQEDVAQRIGRSRSAVANALRLLNLPLEVQNSVSRGTLTMGQVRPLLALEDPKKQIEIAERILTKEMSAREVEAYVKKLLAGKEQKKPHYAKDIHLAAFQDKLSLSLGTKVNIVKTGKKGKITIDFYSDSDLERLLELLTKEEKSYNLGGQSFTV